MSKTRLEFDFDYDFLLFGISCHVKDYRLCWSLNRYIGTDFKRDNDLEIKLAGQEELARFSFYTWDDTDNHLRYFIVANRGIPGLLVQEQKQADYFLLVEGYIDLVDADELLAKLRDINVILTAYQLDPNELRSRQNLIFD